MKIQISILTTFLLVLISYQTLMAQKIDPAVKNLVNQGINKSKKVNIYELRAEQARVDQDLAKATFLPNFTFNSSLTRLNDDIAFNDDTEKLLIGSQKLLIKEGAGIPFNAPFPEYLQLSDVPNLQNKNIFKSSLDLDWVVFSGLKVTNALKASKHKEASLNYLGNAEKDKIALKIIETYDKLALVLASEKVLETSTRYLGKQEFYVNKAIKNGLATPIQRQKIKLAKQQLATKELEFNHNKTLLIEVLHQLTGETRENLTNLNPQLKPIQKEFTLTTAKRNEIKALEEAERATLYKAEMERIDFIPQIAVKGHYEFIEEDLSLLDPKWYIGIGMKWNVFDGFKAKLNSKKSILESEKYRAQIEEAEEMIALSLIKARLNVEAALQNTKLVQDEVELARATYDMINKQYQNNLSSINDVLDALTDLEKANFKLQESFYEQHTAQLEYTQAQGNLTNLYNN